MNLENSYIEILKEELVTALGCTEPLAIAYAAAKGKEVLGCFPEKAVLECSGNIVKNAKSVVVPNTGGLTGIRASMLAGLVGGNCDKKLEVLSDMTPDHITTVKKLLDSDLCEVKLLPTDINLHLVLQLIAENEHVTVEIKHAHINICRITKNGQVICKNDDENKYLGSFIDRAVLSVKGIYEFSNTVPLEKVRDLIEKQIMYNIGIAEEGLRGNYGVSIGRILLDIGQDDPVRTKIKAYAAAASEARMSGCVLPVVINSGSGNQGIATSIPVIIYAREKQVTQDKLYRALVFSNLLTIHQKTMIGRLSAFCGAVSASCSSGAAITYLEGGTLEQIKQTINNTLANVSGIVCDGAKPSCAAKIASCLDAAYMSHVLAMNGKSYQAGNGILKGDVEDTIAAVGRIACNGMRATDTEIIRIMLES
ncbi:MAG: serine dehydratase subunit alpha family protein [Firmicutes bacterium]|nr:serine dehydratase subunit alpha family protein [Bacillota bacterium]